MLKHWVDIGEMKMVGEMKMAESFEKVYGTNPLTNWHVTASDMPGFTSNNNVIEAWNRLIKRYITPGTASIIGKHLLEDLPRMMKLLSSELGATNGGPIKNVFPCSPNGHSLDKAIKMVTEDSDLSIKGEPIVRNYIEVFNNTYIGVKEYKYDFDGYVFNSTSSMCQADMDQAMTDKKAKHFCLILLGVRKQEWNFESFCEIGLRAHAVRITKANPIRYSQ